MVAVIKN
jgi:class 3 adenylate cyclase